MFKRDEMIRTIRTLAAGDRVTPGVETGLHSQKMAPGTGYVCFEEVNGKKHTYSLPWKDDEVRTMNFFYHHGRGLISNSVSPSRMRRFLMRCGVPKDGRGLNR